MLANEDCQNNELRLIDVPITFEYNRKVYHGTIAPVKGAGAALHFFLMIGNTWQGQLFYSEHFGWQYFGNDFDELADYFGEYLMAYYQ